jgi:RNA polymerase sigma factor (TIGR02999 family)
MEVTTGLGPWIRSHERPIRLQYTDRDPLEIAVDAPPDIAVVDEVTGLLRAWREEEGSRSERLLELVYAELKRAAARQLGRERPDHTLQTTALAHEAYLRLVDQTRVDWRDRGHFLAVASTVMRRILVDHARARQTEKRAHQSTSLSSAAEQGADDPELEVLDLDRALDRLGAGFPRAARVVELRYFGGLEIVEIAAVLGVTDRTVKRDWSFAKAWLARELGGEAGA